MTSVANSSSFNNCQDDDAVQTSSSGKSSQQGNRRISTNLQQQNPPISIRKSSTIRSGNSGNAVETDTPSTIEPEGLSVGGGGGGRTSRHSLRADNIRVKWREMASEVAKIDSDESSQAIAMQTLVENELEQAGEPSTSDVMLPRRTLTAQHHPSAHSHASPGLLDGDSVDIRVIITGMHHVGKTCLAECLSQADRIVVNPGREVVRPQRRFPGNPYHTAVVTPRTCCYVTFFDSPMLTSWPTDQLAEFDSFRFPFISTAHAIILAFDLTCPESFDYVKRVKAAIITAAEQQSLIHVPPLFIVGNKADAPRAKSLPRKEDIEGLVTKQWSRELEITTCESLHYCEVSAATGWKVHDLLGTLVLNHLEQHMSLAEAASATSQRQRQRQMRRAMKAVDKRARKARRRRQSAAQSNNCISQ